MKKFLKSDKALCRTPSALLDERIMLAARIAAARNRSKRNLRRFFAISGAAAAALLIGTAVYIHMPQTASREQAKEELLAMNDWSKLEQESYNLSFQLYSEANMLADLNDSQNI